jgi:hypothetical protein
VLQGEKIPSRKELSDEDDQQVTLEGTGCVVWWERWGIAVVAKVLAGCWLQMRTHASQLLCLLARDKPIRRTLPDRSCHHQTSQQREGGGGGDDGDGWIDVCLALRRHTL